MKLLDLQSLSEKCVINLCDGKNLGYICDIQIDIECGKVCSLILPRDQGIFSLGKGDNIIIPWDKIECIGEDAILVKIVITDFCKDDCCNRKGKRHIIF
ncbi:MAG: YlmC/YmxH family sporulation protein [Clostridia bacterium]|nr:YlmC/YmxH family sporulation protein [Clostridia bacterium]